MSNTAMNGTGPNESEQQQDAPVPVPPGTQLRERRNALGWTVEHVANQLKLAPRQIEAIETDNYAALPGIASIRGFIRAYAKLLKVDAGPLVAMIAAEVTADVDATPLRYVVSSKPISNDRLSSMGSFRLPSPSALVGALLVLLVIALAAAQKIGWISVWPESMALRVMADNGLKLLSPPSSVPIGDTSARPLEKSSATVAEALSQQAAVPLSAASSASVSETATSSGDARDIKELLILKVREDSWIDIKRPDDSALISRLVKAGATESFRIRETLSVTIGNAAGVDVIARGTPIDLIAEAKSNVARLTLK